MAAFPFLIMNLMIRKYLCYKIKKKKKRGSELLIRATEIFNLFKKKKPLTSWQGCGLRFCNSIFDVKTCCCWFWLLWFPLKKLRPPVNDLFSQIIPFFLNFISISTTFKVSYYFYLLKGNFLFFSKICIIIIFKLLDFISKTK